MWWLYLIGSLACFGCGFVITWLCHDITYAVIGCVAGIWLLSSARVAYKQDKGIQPSD